MYLFMHNCLHLNFVQNLLFQKNLSICRSVSPDLGPNCLQRVSTDDKPQELDINVDTLPFRDISDAENMKVTKNAN